MSLDDTARSLWAIPKPPLALLTAARATEMLAAPLPEPARTTFDALSAALVAWWPKREREPKDIHQKEFRACADVLAQAPAAAPAMTGTYVQMAALLKVAPRTLPSGGFYDMHEEEFASLLRAAAKAARLPLAQLEARLAFLLERKHEPWPQLVARAARMHWGRSAAWGDLDKRVRDLASFADLGAEYSWSQVGAQNVLELRLDGTKRMAALRPDELAALRTVIPAISEPG